MKRSSNIILEFVVATPPVAFSEILDCCGDSEVEIPKKKPKADSKVLGIKSGRGIRITQVRETPDRPNSSAVWLGHIVDNYDTLARTTVFLNEEHRLAPAILETLTPPTFWDDSRSMGYVGTVDDDDKPWPFGLSAMHAQLHIRAGHENPPSAGLFRVGGQFWVNKEQVMKSPRSFYEGYLNVKSAPHFDQLLGTTWHTVFKVYAV